MRIEKAIKKFQQMTPVAKTTLVLIIAKFFQKGLAMISSPIFTRIMPSSEYGVISTFTSWQSVLYIIATLNMASGVFNNGMLEFKNDRDTFTFSILTLANVCTLICTAVYFLLYRWLNPLIDMPGIFLWIMLVYFFVTPAYNYWLGRSRFEYNYIQLFFVSILTSFFSTVLAIGVVIIVPENMKAVSKVLMTESVAILLGITFYIRTVIKSRARVKIQYWKYALSINLPLVPHYLSMYVLSSSDRIMITKLINTSATAVYNVAYTAAAVVLIFWNSIDAAYAPWIYQKMEAKEYSALQKRAMEVILLFAGAATSITLFAPEVMRILGPEEYYGGIYVIPSVVAGVFFTAIFTLYMRIELYLKKSSTIMIATVYSAVANLFLNYIFIPRIGYTAAGYTTLVCYILLAAFHAINLKRLGYGEVYNNKKIWAVAVVVCCVIVSVSLIYPYTIIRYCMICILMLVIFYKRKEILSIVRKKKTN